MKIKEGFLCKLFGHRWFVNVYENNNKAHAFCTRWGCKAEWGEYRPFGSGFFDCAHSISESPAPESQKEE